MKCWSHQSRPRGSGQLRDKLKQRRKICTVGPKLQNITTHSTGNVTQIPAGKGSPLKVPLLLDLNLQVSNNNLNFWYKSTNLMVPPEMFSNSWISLNKS